MHQDTLDRELFSFTSDPLPSHQPEPITPAFVRHMAARMALETRKIERVAQEAMHEVWEESAHYHPLAALTAQAI